MLNNELTSWAQTLQWTPSHEAVSFIFLIVATLPVMMLVASVITSPGVMGVLKSLGMLDGDGTWISDCWVDIVGYE